MDEVKDQASSNSDATIDEQVEHTEPVSGDVHYTFITGNADRDINTFAQMLTDEAAQETEDLFKQAEIIQLSGLPVSTAHKALMAYDDFLLKNKMAFKKKGSDVRSYRLRTANFLRYQASYRAEYGGMSIKTFLDRLQSSGNAEQMFVTNEEKSFLKIVTKMDSNNQMLVNNLVDRVVSSTKASTAEIASLVERINAQLDTKISNEYVLERLQKMSEQSNDLRVTETNSLLDGIRSLQEQNEQLRNLIMSGGESTENKDDLLEQLEILKDQNRKLETKYKMMLRDVEEYLDRIDDEAMRMNKDTDTIGFMGLNKLKAANKDHYERIKQCIDQAKKRIGL